MRDNPKKYANGRPALPRRFWLTNQTKLIPTASQVKRSVGMLSNIFSVAQWDEPALQLVQAIATNSA
jgi:hypothetical protein